MYSGVRTRALLDPKFHKSLLDKGLDLLAKGDGSGRVYIETYIEILTEKIDACNCM